MYVSKEKKNIQKGRSEHLPDLILETKLYMYVNPGPKKKDCHKGQFF